MFDTLKRSTEYQKIQGGLAAKGPAALFGLPPAGRAQLLALLAAGEGRSLLVVTAGEAEATRFAADLAAFGLPAAVFPPRDFVLRPLEGAGREYEYRRLAVLGDLVGGRLKAVCAPAEAFLQYTVPRAEFCANTLTPDIVQKHRKTTAKIRQTFILLSLFMSFFIYDLNSQSLADLKKGL